MHHTTFSDHTRVSTSKFMNSVWNRKWVVWHMNKWSYICSIILWTYHTAFLGNLKRFPLPSLCRAVYPCTLQCNIVRHCRPLPTAIHTGCPRRNVQYFGRVFLMLNYTDITQNTYPKLNGYGDNDQRKVWVSGVSTYCTPSVTPYSYTAHARQRDTAS